MSLISFKIDKSKAMLLARKAIQGKFAILSETSDTIKVGTPPLMVATIKFSGNTIEFSGNKVIGNTCLSAIKLEIEMYEDSQEQIIEPKVEKQEIKKGFLQSEIAKPSDTGSSADIDYEINLVNLLIKYNELLNLGLIDQELFDYKKQQLLCAINEIKKRSYLVVSEEKNVEEKEKTFGTVNEQVNSGNSAENNQAQIDTNLDSQDIVIPIEIDEDKVKCPKCDFIQPKNRKCCWHCGANFQPDTDFEVSTNDEDINNKEDSEDLDGLALICPNCGSSDFEKLTDDIFLCCNCWTANSKSKLVNH